MTIGAMKAGTTYLYDLLVQHHNIAPCMQKEPCFFADAPGYETYYKGIDYYRSLWPNFDPKVHRYAIDGSVNNTKLPEFPNAAERIASIPDSSFKFIYVVRNPLERIRSHIQYMEVYRRREGILGDNLMIGRHALHITQYARQISEYYKWFRKEDIKIILFEDLIVEPQMTCEQLFNFLKLDPVKINLHKEKNITKEITYKEWVFNLRHKIPLRYSFRKVIPKFIKKKLLDKRVSSFQLSEHDKEEILEFLRTDLIRLKDEFGVDTDKWRLPL